MWKDTSTKIFKAVGGILVAVGFSAITALTFQIQRSIDEVRRNYSDSFTATSQLNRESNRVTSVSWPDARGQSRQERLDSASFPVSSSEPSDEENFVVLTYALDAVGLTHGTADRAFEPSRGIERR